MKTIRKCILAAVLILAMWLQVTIGLKPLERLRRAVSNVVTGNAARLETTVPTEVQPLADEINRLLDSQAKALARAVIAMAHAVKLEVVAEGVDAAEQANLLREFGCDAIQGFLYGAAVAPPEFERRWLRGRTRSEN